MVVPAYNPELGKLKQEDEEKNEKQHKKKTLLLVLDLWKLTKYQALSKCFVPWPLLCSGHNQDGVY